MAISSEDILQTHLGENFRFISSKITMYGDKIWSVKKKHTFPEPQSGNVGTVGLKNGFYRTLFGFGLNCLAVAISPIEKKTFLKKFFF